MEAANLKLLILHEHELRAAAKMLEAALDAQNTDNFPEAVRDALNACIVALYGLHDKDMYPVAMLSNTRRLFGGEAESVPTMGEEG